MSPPCEEAKGPETGLKASKLGRRSQNWAEGPKTGSKAQFGGLWTPNRPNAGQKPA